ncbi:MAG: sporulation initiation factor Spo0A C-terminal domain-containing protein [[Clostridium] scindens]
MEKYIRKLLLNLGIRSTYQGFPGTCSTPCCCAWKMMNILDRSASSCIQILPKKFSTTVDNVEHCLRTVISYCWYHGNRRFLIDITGYPLSDKPTNSEFLDILYNYLKFFPEG